MNKQNSSDKISIITIVLNGQNDIEQTILSVITQRKQNNIEYILIDGGSSDLTLSIIDKYRDYIDIVISEKDGGIYNAINKGINLCTGQLVGIINCGDTYSNECLAYVSSTYRESRSNIIYGNMNLVKKIGDEVLEIKKIADHYELENKMSIFHPSTFVERDVYLKYGLYDEAYTIAADYNMMLFLYRSGCSFYHIDQVLSNFKSGGISDINYLGVIKEVYRIKSKQVGFFNAIKYYSLAKALYVYYNSRKKLVDLLINEELKKYLKRLMFQKND